MQIPSSLRWLRDHPDGGRWFESLPELVAAVAEDWSLTLGDPYEGAYTSLVMPAQTPAGEPFVLKLQFPDRETAHEADALTAWGGSGAVRLIDHDRQRNALLLERCEPGTPLSAEGAGVALGVLAGLLPELWIPAPAPVGTLEAEAGQWRANLPMEWERAGGPFERRLLDVALEALDDLAGSQGEPVLLHQDLHGGNVLSAARRPWLVIDPKPLAGEREFSVAPIVRSRELGATKADVMYRLDRLCDELGLDRDRARRWTLAQTLAWGFEHDRALEWHVQVARWLAR